MRRHGHRGGAQAAAGGRTSVGANGHKMAAARGTTGAVVPAPAERGTGGGEVGQDPLERRVSIYSSAGCQKSDFCLRFAPLPKGPAGEKQPTSAVQQHVSIQLTRDGRRIAALVPSAGRLNFIRVNNLHPKPIRLTGCVWPLTDSHVTGAAPRGVRNYRALPAGKHRLPKRRAQVLQLEAISTGCSPAHGNLPKPASAVSLT